MGPGIPDPHQWAQTTSSTCCPLPRAASSPPGERVNCPGPQRRQDGGQDPAWAHLHQLELPCLPACHSCRPGRPSFPC